MYKQSTNRVQTKYNESTTKVQTKYKQSTKKVQKRLYSYFFKKEDTVQVVPNACLYVKEKIENAQKMLYKKTFSLFRAE